MKSLFAIALLVLGSTALVAGPAATEPTNAAEAAAKKAAAEAAVAAKYEAWVATLSPERQAWETVLQENLGSFYLPIHQKEKVEGRMKMLEQYREEEKNKFIDKISRLTGRYIYNI